MLARGAIASGAFNWKAKAIPATAQPYDDEDYAYNQNYGAYDPAYGDPYADPAAPYRTRVDLSTGSGTSWVLSGSRERNTAYWVSPSAIPTS